MGLKEEGCQGGDTFKNLKVQEGLRTEQPGENSQENKGNAWRLHCKCLSTRTVTHLPQQPSRERMLVNHGHSQKPEHRT